MDWFMSIVTQKFSLATAYEYLYFINQSLNIPYSSGSQCNWYKGDNRDT